MTVHPTLRRNALRVLREQVRQCHGLTEATRWHMIALIDEDIALLDGPTEAMIRRAVDIPRTRPRGGDELDRC